VGHDVEPCYVISQEYSAVENKDTICYFTMLAMIDLNEGI